MIAELDVITAWRNPLMTFATALEQIGWAKILSMTAVRVDLPPALQSFNNYVASARRRAAVATRGTNGRFLPNPGGRATPAPRESVRADGEGNLIPVHKK